jgi:hypothetical protein
MKGLCLHYFQKTDVLDVVLVGGNKSTPHRTCQGLGAVQAQAKGEEKRRGEEN